VLILKKNSCMMTRHPYCSKRYRSLKIFQKRLYIKVEGCMLCETKNDVLKLVKKKKYQLHPILVYGCLGDIKEFCCYPI